MGAPDPPRRIVSLVPSSTYSVWALGAAESLVGVTRYCVEPARIVAGVGKVGGTKNPARERIADLEPDLVLVNREENRVEDIEWLGGRFEVFESTPCTVAEAGRDLGVLGERLGRQEEAHALKLELEAQLARAGVESMEGRWPRVLYPIWPKPWMGVGGGTYLHDFLVRAATFNVTADLGGRYPMIPEEDLAGLEPDLVLLPSEPWEFDERQRRELMARGVFGRGVPVLLVDGRDFCWHGARTGEGLGRALDLLRPFRT